MAMSLKKIIEYGSYLLLFTLPWQSRWIIYAGKINGGSSEYLTYSLYAADVLAIILILLAGWNLWSTGQLFQKRELGRIKSSAAFVVGIFVAFVVAQAQDKNLAMFVMIRLALAIAVFRLLLKFAEKSSAVLWLVLGLVPAAWLGVWQFFMQETFASKWLGLASHVAAEPGTSVIERYPVGQLPERWLRAYGSFDHPNMLGGAMAIGLIFSLWLLTEWYYQKDKEKLRSLLYVVIASLAAGLFVSFSRGAWLGLLIGVLIPSVIMLCQRHWAEFRPWLVGSFIMVAIFVFFLVPYRSLVSSRFVAQTRLEQKSNTERLASYHQAKTLLGQHGLVGVGPGNYVAALAESESGNPAWYYQPTHNVWLLIWVELGVVGILVAVSSFVYGLWRSFKTKNILALSLLSSFGLMSQVDHWWLSLHFGILFFAVSAGLVVLSKKTIEI